MMVMQIAEDFPDPQKKHRGPKPDALELMVREAQEWVESVFADEVPELTSATSEGGNGDDDEATDSSAADAGADAGSSSDDKHHYESLQKAVVLQEARIFHNDRAVKEDPSGCLRILAQLLRIKDDPSQKFSEMEATEVFFGTTKLFVCEDEYLRRFVYLFLKEIYTLCDPNDVIIVTSSLTKDMACDIDLYRANALRVLSLILDTSMLGAIERYIKQSIVDKCQTVSSAGLLAGLRLYDLNQDSASIIKKWISEIHVAIKTHPNGIVQFHAILLLYKMKQNDRLAINKIVSQYRRKGCLEHPLAVVMLIRFTAKLMVDELAAVASPSSRVSEASQVLREGYQFLLSCLRHSKEMVMFEAARAINLLPIEYDEAEPTVNTLLSLSKSPKPCDKIAALRILSQLAIRFPSLASRCNEELGKMIAHPNQTISVLAITVLLRTGSDDTQEALLEHIIVCFQTMEDEHKISITRALLELCVAFPEKCRRMVSFLSQFLMEKAQYEFKRAVVDGLIELTHALPGIADYSLSFLGQSLETCEHVHLTTQILHLLAELGPATCEPSQHVLNIYNCFLLGGPSVRGAAVSALSRYASSCPSLRESLLVLLEKCQIDEDEETRDRAVSGVRVLRQAMLDCPHVPLEDVHTPEETRPVPEDIAAHVYAPLPVSFDQLQRQLNAYMATPGEMESEEPVAFDTLPFVEEEVQRPSNGISLPNSVMPLGALKRADPAQVIYDIPELAALGKIFRTTSPVALTENETEYVVFCTKHIYEEYVVLQFMIHNTVETQRLDNVSVAIVASEEDLYEPVGEIVSTDINCGETKNCFTVLKRNPGEVLIGCTFGCELQFLAVTVDEDTNEQLGEAFEEEYPLENLEIPTSDFMAKIKISDFRQSWESMPAQVTKKFGLEIETTQEAVEGVVSYLGMEACDRTGVVDTSKNSHLLHLSGMYYTGQRVLARAQLVPTKGVMMLKIAIRSEEQGVAQAVLDCIH